MIADNPNIDENTERPDRDRAQAALDKTPSDMMRTAAAVAESQRLMAIVRQRRVENHFADKFRTIIIGHP